MLGFFIIGIICPHLDDLQYGSVNVSSYYPDSRVHYYCNKGYKLVGDPYRVCLYDGTWNKKTPVCKSKYYLWYSIYIYIYIYIYITVGDYI